MIRLFLKNSHLISINVVLHIISKYGISIDNIFQFKNFQLNWQTGSETYGGSKANLFRHHFTKLVQIFLNWNEFNHTKLRITSITSSQTHSYIWVSGRRADCKGVGGTAVSHWTSGVTVKCLSLCKLALKSETPHNRRIWLIQPEKEVSWWKTQKTIVFSIKTLNASPRKKFLIEQNKNHFENSAVYIFIAICSSYSFITLTNTEITFGAPFMCPEKCV